MRPRGELGNKNGAGQLVAWGERRLGGVLAVEEAQLRAKEQDCAVRVAWGVRGEGEAVE